MRLADLTLDLFPNKTKKSIKKWLDGASTAQLEWAINYLNSKGETIRNNSHEELFNWATKIENTAHNELIIRKMKSAWRQAKLRSINTEKKSYSFTLNIESKDQLDRLSKRNRKTISETLEDLIIQATKKAQKADEKKDKAKTTSEPTRQRKHDW